MKIKRYRKQYNHCPFETYQPKKRVDVSKEQVVPFLVRVGNFFSGIGVLPGFFITSFWVVVKGCFGVKQKVRDLDPRRKRIVEFKIKKKDWERKYY